MVISIVILGDIIKLKGDVSKVKEDILSISRKVSMFQIEMISVKQDISFRYIKIEVDNKLKNKVEVNDLESGRYGGDFYLLIGREVFYLWNLVMIIVAVNFYFNFDFVILFVLWLISFICYKYLVEIIDLEYVDFIFRMCFVWYRS